MTRILIANPSPDMGAAIEAMLDEALGERQTFYTHVRDAAKARAAVEAQAHDVLILNLDLAADKKSSVASWKGLQLATELRARWPGLPLVLTSTHTTPELSERVAMLGLAALVLEGRTFEEYLGARVAAFAAMARGHDNLASEAPPPNGIRVATNEPTRFVIEIHLRADGDCDYRAKSVGGLVPFISELPLTVKAEDLQELVSLTAKLVDSERWQDDYKTLGDRLRGVLLESNIEVIRDLSYINGLMHVEQPGAHPAICFVVDKGLHPIALEALRENAGGAHYWLERAPLWRRLALNGSRRFPLFRDLNTRDSPINCLVVDAAAAGEVKGLGVKVSDIPGVREEARSLFDYLLRESTVPLGKIGCIWCEDGEVMKSIRSQSDPPDAQGGGKGEPCPGSFSEVLRDTLTSGEPWQLVHYAGHSYYDAENDYGYLLLPGDRHHAAQELDYVGVKEFAHWLARTRFVYMSSCKGASQDFVFNLCMRGVPALAGFRWDIEDDMAIEHSRSFYRRLFEHRSIEGALFETWNHMFGRHPGNRVWASSQLVMQ